MVEIDWLFTLVVMLPYTWALQGGSSTALDSSGLGHTSATALVPKPPDRGGCPSGRKRIPCT